MLEEARLAVGRSMKGRFARSVVLVGLRGVGKTVLLNRIARQAQEAGALAVRVEAPEDRSLPELLSPRLRAALLRLSRSGRRQAVEQALRALAGFVRAFRLRYQDLEVGVDWEPEPGVADSGDLEQDLADLLVAAGRAAREAGSMLVLLLDELQYVDRPGLAALLHALHETSQQEVPVLLVGAGLPQLPGLMGEAKSYAERLVRVMDVGPLDAQAAREALVRPAEREGGRFTEPALDRILAITAGYPYFLQEWAKHAWDEAEGPAITDEDVERASAVAVAELDAGFFRVRYDRLTRKERLYLRAMAELGPGPHRSGEIARLLGRSVQAAAGLRDQLIRKGMIWSPRHGDTAFTAPLFDRFMRRIMPQPPE